MSANAGTTQDTGRRRACANPSCTGVTHKKYCKQPCAARHIALRRSGHHPANLTAEEFKRADMMLFELQESEGLRVSTEITDDRRILRRVDSQNPKWFQEFSSMYQHAVKLRTWKNGRKAASKNQHKNHYTYIDRRRALAALRRIVKESLVVGVYGERLERFIKRKSEPYKFEDGITF